MSVWTAGVPSDLGSNNGVQTSFGRAWDINNNGIAVGVTRRDTTTSVSQATLWAVLGSPRNLGSLQANSYSEAVAINDSGFAVGTAVNGSTQFGTNPRREAA